MYDWCFFDALFSIKNNGIYHEILHVRGAKILGKYLEQYFCASPKSSCVVLFKSSIGEPILRMDRQCTQHGFTFRDPK